MNSQVVRGLQPLLCTLLLWTTVLSAQEVRLEYKFRIGEVNRYKETTQNDITSDMMTTGGQKVFNEIYTTQKVVEVNPDGSAEVIQTIDSVHTLFNGQPYSNPQTAILVGLPVRVTVTATGKILDAQSTGDTSDATAKDAVDVLRRQLMTQPSYPSTAITMNKPWDDSATFSQATQIGTITSNIRYSTTLTGSDRIRDTEVKVLERTVDVSGTISNDAGRLKGTGNGNIYFSDVLGKEIRSTLTIQQTMDMVTPQGSLKMDMKISTTRELLK